MDRPEIRLPRELSECVRFFAVHCEPYCCGFDAFGVSYEVLDSYRGRVGLDACRVALSQLDGLIADVSTPGTLVYCSDLGPHIFFKDNWEESIAFLRKLRGLLASGYVELVEPPMHRPSIEVPHELRECFYRCLNCCHFECRSGFDISPESVRAWLDHVGPEAARLALRQLDELTPMVFQPGSVVFVEGMGADLFSEGHWQESIEFWRAFRASIASAVGV